MCPAVFNLQNRYGILLVGNVLKLWRKHKNVQRILLERALKYNTTFTYVGKCKLHEHWDLVWDVIHSQGMLPPTKDKEGDKHNNRDKNGDNIPNATTKNNSQTTQRTANSSGSSNTTHQQTPKQAA